VIVAAIGKVRWRRTSCVGRPRIISALGCCLIYTGHAYRRSKQVPHLRIGRGFLSPKRNKISRCLAALLAIASTTSIPYLGFPGSRLEADHPEKGVLFACRFTYGRVPCRIVEGKPHEPSSGRIEGPPSPA